MFWCGFGVAQVAVSALLLALGRIALWSVFVNLLDLPLLATVFAAEYALRRWRFRGHRLAGPRDMARLLLDGASRAR